jgi:hypothetical protein
MAAGAARINPAPVAMECARCQVTAIVPVDDLLPGWGMVGDRPYCADCLPHVTIAAPSAPIADGCRLHPIGPAGETSIYRGCRMAHDVQLGTVGLRIHGGVSPPPGERDAPVQFLLTTVELDQLIARLEVIQLELNAQRNRRDTFGAIDAPAAEER